MRYQIKRASQHPVTTSDVPWLVLETNIPYEDADPEYYVELPPGYRLEEICEATHQRLILNPFDKTLTIYDDYVE